MVQSIDPSGLSAITSGASLQTLVNNQNSVLGDLARSGFQGLLNSLNAANAVQQAFAALGQINDAVQQAVIQATKDPFVSASSALQSSTVTAVTQGLLTQQNNEFDQINQASTAATQAQAGTKAKTPEADAAAQVVSANNELVAVENAIKSGKLQNAVSDTQTAISDAQKALTAAQDAYNKAPSDEKAAALAVVNAAQQNLTAAQGLLPVAQHAAIANGQATPQVYDLGDGYSATTWGNTGYWSLVDPNGKGILVAPDGSVSNLDGSDQWQFQTTSTFHLPDDTKITMTPGASGATVQIIRGAHHLEFDGLGTSSPTVGGPDETGRKVDANDNDGYIFNLGSDAGQWTLNGFNITNGSTVAAQPLTNKLKVDPTAISISPDLAAYLASQGITLQSYANNGKYNDTELFAGLQGIITTANSLSNTFTTILQASALANGSMANLTTFLQQLQIKQGLKTQQRSQEQLQTEILNEPTEQQTIATIRQQLDAAQRLLNANSNALQPVTISSTGPAPTVLNLSTPTLSQNPPSTANLIGPQVPGRTGATNTALNTNLGQNRASRLLGNVPLQVLEAVTSALNQPPSPTQTGTAGPGGGPEATVSQVNPFTVGGQTVLNTITNPASNEEVTSAVKGPEGNIISVPNLPGNIPSISTGFESASQPLGETKPSVTVSQVNPFTVGGQTVANPITSPASNEELTSQVVGPGGKVISVPNLPGNIPSISSGFEAASQLPGATEPNVPPLIPVNPNAVGELIPTTSVPLAPITSQPVTPTSNQTNLPFPVIGSPVVATVLHSDRIFTQETETPDTLPSTHNLVRGKSNPSPLATLETQSANTSNAELTAINRQVQALFQAHSDQMTQANAIFNTTRDNVKTFLKVVDQSDALSKSVYSADLSKQEQAAFAATMTDLRQRLGLSGGSYVSSSQDPAVLDSSDKSQLLNKLMNAGLTI